MTARARAARPPPATLRLAFTRLGDDRHAFSYRRPDGSGERVELETRSLLAHDLIHLAVESEAGLVRSFYGRLLAGESLADLAHDARGGVFEGESGQTERVVGALTRLWSAPEPEAGALLDSLQAQSGLPAPYLDAGFVMRVAERLRALRGAWRATPFGGELSLSFPQSLQPNR